MSQTLVQQASGGAASGTASPSATFSTGATAGNIIWCAVGMDKDSGAITRPSGFTDVVSHQSASVSTWVGYKVSTGGETTITLTHATTSSSGDTMWIGEYSDTAGTSWSILGSASDLTTETTRTVTPTGTTSATSAAGQGLAFFTVDSGTSWVGSQSYTNGYTTVHGATTGPQADVIVAGLANVASGTAATTTLTHTSTADQTSGVIVVFAASGGGGGGGGTVDLDLTYVGASAWQAPASSATISPTYPASLAQGDIVYAELVIKPDTATVATPTNWTLVTSQAVGGGTQGAGTGAVKVWLFRRVVPSGGLTGSEAFTITSGSSPVGCMRAFRADQTATGITYEAETSTFYSRTTGSTTFGGTGAADITLAAKDALVYISASSDDQSSTHTISGLAATGATLGTVTQSPTGTVINAQGNDISAAAAYALVTAGASTAAPSATVTGSSAETGGGFFYRVSATGVLASTVSLTPAVVATSAVAVTPVPQPVTVTATPAVIATAAVALTPVPQPVTVALTPAVVAVSAVAVTPAPAPGLVTLTPAVIAVMGVAVTPVPQQVTTSLTPAALAVTGVAVTPVPQPVTTALTAAVAALSAVAVTPVPQPVTVALTPAVVTLAAQTVTPIPQTVTTTLTAAVVAFAAQPVSPVPQPVTVSLTPAAVAFTAVTLTITQSGTVSAQPAVLTLTARPVTPVPQPVTVTLTAAVVTFTAVALGGGATGSTTITPAGITLTAQPLTPVPQPVTVTLTAGVVTLTGQPVTPVPQAVTITLTPAGLQIAGQPVTAVPQTVTVDLQAALVALAAVVLTAGPAVPTQDLSFTAVLLRSPWMISETPDRYVWQVAVHPWNADTLSRGEAVYATDRAKFVGQVLTETSGADLTGVAFQAAIDDDPLTTPDDVVVAGSTATVRVLAGTDTRPVTAGVHQLRVRVDTGTEDFDTEVPFYVEPAP